MKTLKVLVVITAITMLQLMVVSSSLAAPTKQAGSAGGTYHTVCGGDTLFSIGRRYGANAYQIAEANGLSNPDYIYVGQVLYIPSGYGYGNPGHGRRPAPPARPVPNVPNYDQTGPYNYGYQDYPPYGNQYPTYGHGYDETGYYYYNNYPNYSLYSYTCGYNYNCY